MMFQWGKQISDMGNNFRLKNKLARARSGTDTVVAYIGGSITAGMGAENGKSYTELFFSNFAEKYCSDENVKYVNAAISGTSSTLGIIRLENDVLSKNPDIVFVEYAVNDSTELFAGKCYESLIRTLLESSDEPAVVLIMCSLKSGYTAQEQMKKIGKHYNLPVISVADALKNAMGKKQLVWKDYSDDESHPNGFGHREIAGFITEFFDQTDNNKQDMKYCLPKDSRISSQYVNMQSVVPSLSSRENISVTDNGDFVVDSAGGSYTFSESWHCEKCNKPMIISVYSDSLFVAYKKGKEEFRGDFDIYIDNVLAKTIDTYDENGWGEPYGELIAEFEEPRKFEVLITARKTVDILSVSCTPIKAD